MEILQLKYFKDAAETENFSKAAEKNMVPQPSISSSIKWLENELSVPLFDRSGRKIFLNENGDFFMSPLDADFTTAHPNTHIIYATGNRSFVHKSLLMISRLWNCWII